MQGVPDPSPRAQALLGDVATAVAELRRAEARVLAAVAALERDGAAAETGHRSTGRLLQEHVRIDATEAKTWRRHASLVTARPGLSNGTLEPTLPAQGGALMAWRREQQGDEDGLPVRLRRWVAAEWCEDTDDRPVRYYGVLKFLRARVTWFEEQGHPRDAALRLAQAESSHHGWLTDSWRPGDGSA